MQIKPRPLISLLTIGLFLAFALASDLLDESTNTTVIAENCETKPEFSGVLTVSVQYLDFDGFGVENAECDISITHQLINNIDCTAEVVEEFNKKLFTDGFGRCSFETPLFIHTNSADLFRVDVLVTPDPDDIIEIPPFQQVQVAAYNVTSLDFYKQSVRPLK